MSLLVSPDQIFFDNDTGRPLALGTVYFGEPNQDPETNTKQPFSDRGLSTAISATQSLNAAGKFAQRVWLSGPYSIRVKDASGVTVFTELYAEGIGDGSEADFSYGSVAALIASSNNSAFDTIYIKSYYAITYPSTAGPKGGHLVHRTGGTNDSPSVGTAVAVSTIGTGTQAGYYWDADGIEWKVALWQFKYTGIPASAFGLVLDDSTDDTTKFNDWIGFNEGSVSVKKVLDGPTVVSGITADVEGLILAGINNSLESSNKGSRITMDATDATALTINADHLSIENIDIYGSGNNQDGLYIYNSAGGSTVRQRITLRDVTIKGFTQTGYQGLYIARGVGVSLNGVKVENCYDGCLIENSTTVFISEDSKFRENTRDGMRINASSGITSKATFEGNGEWGCRVANNASKCDGLDFSGSWWEGNVSGHLRAGIAASSSCDGLIIHGGKATGANNNTDIGFHIDSTCNGVSIKGVHFEEFDNAQGNDVAILVDSAATGVEIGPNSYLNNTNDVTDNSNKALIYDESSNYNQRIGTNVATPGNGNNSPGIELDKDGRFTASYAGDHGFNRIDSNGDILYFARNGSSKNEVSIDTDMTWWSNPHGIPAYTVATLPSAATYNNSSATGLIYVTDETGGATLAYSDGTNWRRVQDRAVVS